MMAFNPAAFNTAQLLAASQPTTPLKVDGLDGATADPMRYLAQLQLPIQGMPPVLGQPPFPFMFPAVQPDFKPEMLTMGGGPMPPFFLEAMSAYHPYAAGLDGARRKNATRETTLPLKNWLNEHRKNPYPTKGEKVMLAVVTKMTLTQVSTWFANARRRLKKENKMTWSPKHGQRDDDDDFGDIDANRPSSSASNISDAPGDLSADLSSNNNELKVGSASPMDAVRKPTKIWSIADTLVKDEEEENKKEVKDEAGSSNKAAHHLSEEPQLNFQQQMLAAMSRINPQMLSALRPGFPAAMFPHLHPQLLSLMSLAPQMTPVSSAALASAGLNGSFSSEAPSSVSPSSSHSDAKAEPCSPPAKSPASNNGSSN